VAGVLLRDLAAPDLQLPLCLAQEVEEVVEKHPPDDRDDQHDIDRRDPVEQR
jgi:hypothetical protein